MKKIALLFAFALFASSAYADIQSPPGGRDNRISKLSRGLSNIVYGVVEVPGTWNKTRLRGGSTQGASLGLVTGAKRSIVRMGFGLYEVVTFPFPTYKDGYKSPLPKKEKWDVNHGYSAYPRELGFQSVNEYVRSQPY